MARTIGIINEIPDDNGRNGNLIEIGPFYRIGEMTRQFYAGLINVIHRVSREAVRLFRAKVIAATRPVRVTSILEIRVVQGVLKI